MYVSREAVWEELAGAGGVPELSLLASPCNRSADRPACRAVAGESADWVALLPQQQRREREARRQQEREQRRREQEEKRRLEELERRRKEEEERRRAEEERRRVEREQVSPQGACRPGLWRSVASQSQGIRGQKHARVCTTLV